MKKWFRIQAPIRGIIEISVKAEDSLDALNQAKNKFQNERKFKKKIIYNIDSGAASIKKRK